MEEFSIRGDEHFDNKYKRASELVTEEIVRMEIK
jgi:hypothetical protein